MPMSASIRSSRPASSRIAPSDGLEVVGGEGQLGGVDRGDEVAVVDEVRVAEHHRGDPRDDEARQLVDVVELLVEHAPRLLDADPQLGLVGLRGGGAHGLRPVEA